MLPAVGGIVDRYRLERMLGSGGLGEVWEVEHRVLGTRRAIKVLKGGRGDLIAEGRVQARMDHPNVLPVLDAFTHGDRVALVLPLVRGPSLARLIRVYDLSASEVCALAEGIAAGLSFAHGRGVAHRDLKPANVLLDPSGTSVRPRIADFGLASTLGNAAGTGAGTPGYAAPEQLAGKRVDVRADWWSYGVVLYEMLVGRRPFVQIIPKAGQSWVQDPPPAWIPLLRSLLQVDPAGRLCDGDAILGAVQALAGESHLDPLAADSPLAGVVHRHLSRELSLAGSPQTAFDVETLPTQATLAPVQSSPSFATEPADAHNLPSPRGTLVGRGEVLRTLHRRLVDESVRVLTVTGPGGVGKSRLVQGLALGIVLDFAGGVWLADLSAAVTVADVQLQLADALSVRLPDEPARRLADALSGRGRTLVILDNAESVLEAARTVMGKLLDAAPDLTVLVTSREPLRLAGESVHTIDVLELPAEDHEQDEIDAASASPAVQLFVERARSARSDFALTPENAGVVIELVRLLDGLPLAIELAAARVRVLTPAKLLQRMSRRFDLLVRRRGADDIPRRQRTLRATLMASWDALDPHEQSALAQLGVFEGRPTLEDVEAVVELDADAPLVEDVLAELVDKSLVRVEHAGEVRFELLASIRDLAREQLAAMPTLDAAHDRHAAHFARWGRSRLRDVLGGHGGVAKRRALQTDRPDLLQAITHARSRGQTDTAVAAVIGAWAEVETTGPLARGAELIEQVLPLAPDHAELLRCAGQARWRVGDRPGASRAFHASMAAFEAMGDSLGKAEAHNGLGLVALSDNDVDAAEAHFIQAAELADLSNNARVRGVAESNRVLVAWRRRDVGAATHHARVAMPLHEQAGDVQALGRTTGNLGVLQCEQGELAEAEALFGRALVALRATGNVRDEGLFLGQLGLLRTELGRLEAAERALRRSLRLVQRVGARNFEASCLGNLGVLLGLLGRWDEAGAHHSRARQLHEELGDARSVTIDTLNLGIVALEQGERVAASMHLDAAMRGASATQDLRAQGAIYVERARLALAGGDLNSAGTELDRAEALLAGHGGKVEQAKAHCVRVEWLLAHGDSDAAVVGIAEIAEVAQQVGAGPRSSLGQALDRARGKAP